MHYHRHGHKQIDRSRFSEAEDGTEVITLKDVDESKTLNENAQRYFKLYTKSKTTKVKSEEMLAELEMEREYLENVLYSIEQANSLKELEEIKNGAMYFVSDCISWY